MRAVLNDFLQSRKQTAHLDKLLSLLNPAHLRAGAIAGKEAEGLFSFIYWCFSNLPPPAILSCHSLSSSRMPRPPRVARARACASALSFIEYQTFTRQSYRRACARAMHLPAINHGARLGARRNIKKTTRGALLHFFFFFYV